MNNIHPHQIRFMEDFQRQGGIAFLLVYFLAFNKYYMLPFHILKAYWDKAQNGGRKSIPYEAFPKDLEVFSKEGAFVHYLETLNILLSKYKMISVYE